MIVSVPHFYLSASLRPKISRERLGIRSLGGSEFVHQSSGNLASFGEGFADGSLRVDFGLAEQREEWDAGHLVALHKKDILHAHVFCVMPPELGVARNVVEQNLEHVAARVVRADRPADIGAPAAVFATHEVLRAFGERRRYETRERREKSAVDVLGFDQEVEFVAPGLNVPAGRGRAECGLVDLPLRILALEPADQGVYYVLFLFGGQTSRGHMLG